MHSRSGIAGVLALVALALPNSAQAVPWRSFGYPAQHTDTIGTKADDDSAAFNLHCLPGNNLFLVQMRNGPPRGHTTLLLSVDGRVVARGAATVDIVGGVSWIDLGGKGTTDVAVARWLHGIASARSDISISAGRHTAHLPLQGAASAATTALSYCKFP